MRTMRIRLGSMAIAAAAICTWLGVASATVRAEDHVQKGDIVAVCGDSITEQKDYSGLIETYLAACQQDGPIRTAQFGWSGDSMGWFWGRGGPGPILSIHPTVVTTCYGMNDGGYKPVEEKTITQYRDGMNRLVKELKAGGVRFIVVGSPGAVDSDTWRNNPEQATMYNKTLASLRDVAKQIAQEQGCGFANVHDVMMDVMTKAKAKYGPKYHVAGGDGVHPGYNGHLVMAYAFLKAMGCDGNIGTITVDMAGKATATDGHKVLSSAAGSAEIESTRYPFCFYGKPEDPNATTGIIEFLPFNQDLNRLTLKVTGLPADGEAKVRVTWGAASKEFSAADLTKGINLAAEFVNNNPFSEPFFKLRQVVRGKQDWETTFYKNYLSGGLTSLLKDVREGDPEAAAALDAALAGVTPALVKKDAKLAGTIAAAVVPVKHTIKVELVK